VGFLGAAFTLVTVVAAASGQDLAGNLRSSIAHYRMGEIFLNQHNYQSAANEFRSALNGDLEPKWTVVWAHIRLGRIFDTTGQHERAVNEYRLAERTQDNTDGALEEVRTYLGESTPPRRLEYPRRRTALDFPVPAGAYRVSKDIAGPEVIEKHLPEYSEEARIAELEGKVFLTGVIDVNGRTRDMQVTGSLGLGLDEKALEAVQGWRFRPGTANGDPVPTFVTLAVEFVLPVKKTRWHLARVAFLPQEGVSRPTFLSAAYPAGAGVSKPALEEASLVVAIRRQATTTLSFEIDALGRPVNFQVEAASDSQWGAEASAFVREWKFTPGGRDGKAVSVPCMLTLVWGERKMDVEILEQLSATCCIKGE